MEDKQFYTDTMDAIDELMAGVKYIVCDIGRLNEVLIELRKRMNKANKTTT